MYDPNTIPKKRLLSLQLDTSKFEAATDEEKAQADQMRESTTFFRDGMKKLFKNPLAVASIIVLIMLVVTIFVAPVVVPYSYDQMITVDGKRDKTAKNLAAGNIISHTDNYGLNETLTYDAAGRMLTRSYDGTVTETYTYNKNGSIVRATYGDNWWAYEYNAAGLAVSYTDSSGIKEKYTYNAQGRLVSTAHTEPDNNYKETFAYDADGNQTLWTQTSSDFSMSITSVYDNRGCIVSEKQRNEYCGETDTLDITYKYTYDSHGLLIKYVEHGVYGDGTLSDASGANVYEYDASGRLVKDTYTRETLEGEYASSFTVYTYDDAGNLLSEKTDWGDGISSETVYTYRKITLA